MRYSITFDEVRAHAERRERCPVCNRWSKRQRTFVRTVNPFNVDEDGVPKSPEQVRRDVQEDAVSWRPTPDEFTHERCRS